MRDRWRQVRMGDVVQQIRRPVLVRPNHEYPLLGMRWYGLGPFRRETVTGDATKAGTYFRVAAGDLIYNRLFAWKGSFGVIPSDLDGSFVSGEFPLFIVDRDKAVPEFLNLVMCQPPVWGQVWRESTGSTATSRNRWKEDRFLAWQLLLPSVAEQRRIVDLIHHVDQPHDRAHVVAQRARRLGDAVRDEWFTERSTLARPLRSVVEVTNGRLRNPRNASGPHMTRYVRSANVQDGRLDLDEPMHMNFTPAEQKRYALRPGDVLVTEGSGSRASIGASCQWHGQIPGVVCFQNHLLRLRPLPGCGLPPSLIYQWALWSHRTGRFAEIATGTNILSLGVERVAAMSIPVDQPAEVLALVSTMEAIQGEEHAATALAASTAGLRSAVLSALLSGDDQLTPSYDRFLDGAA